MQRGAFQRVVSTARGYVGQGFPVHFRTTLNRKNRGQVAALIDLATELRAYRVTFAGTIPNGLNNDLVLSDAEHLALYRQIEALRQDAKIEVETTAALYTAGGVHLCRALSMGSLYFSAAGELIFCCDVGGPGAVIGTLADQPLSALIEKWIQAAANLQIRRAARIAAGQMGEGFDTCAFCNAYFASDAQPQE